MIKKKISKKIVPKAKKAKKPAAKKKIIKKKVTKKKVAKKIKKGAARVSKKVKKPVRVKKALVPAKRTLPIGKPAGLVTHFYGNLSVAIVKVANGQKIGVGETIYFKGHTTDFKQKVGSMQYFHKPIGVAQAGQEVGIKVKDKTREGDKVYKV